MKGWLSVMITGHPDTLVQDDFVSAIEVQAKNSLADQYNTVKGTYLLAKTDCIPTDYPPVTSATFKTEDNNRNSHWTMICPIQQIQQRKD